MTYQGFAAAWPSRTDEGVVEDVTAGGGSAERTELRGFAARMNSIPKFVVSRTLEKAEWNNSRLINTNVADEISKLKHQPGQDILVAGSADLVQTLRQMTSSMNTGSSCALLSVEPENVSSKMAGRRR